MADTDFTIIKPVEGLQNVQGLSPTKRREERRRRQEPSSQHREPVEAQDESDDVSEEQRPATGDDSHAIDYCA